MKLSARDRALLGAIAALAVLAAFYLFALKPQRDQAKRLGASIATAQQELAAAQAKYASGRAAEQQLDANRPQYLAAEQAVPQTSNIPALLKLLQRKAHEAHVSINTISLGGGSSASSSTPSTQTTSTGSASAGSAETVPVSLTFGGGYQALNRMVRVLDSLVVVSHGHLKVHGPLVGISNVNLSPGTTSGTGGSSALTVQLSATIYQRAAASSASGSTSGGSS